MIQSLIMLHDVDRVSVGDAHGLSLGNGRTTFARNITIRSGKTEFKITLFATDARLLDIVKEG